MPISYRVDRARRVILETWTGEVSRDTLAAYWRTYLADPDVMSVRRTLVDLRECKLLLNGRDLSELIRTVVDPVLRGAKWRTAILVGPPEQFGVARQYHAFAEHYSRDSIFHDRERALAWLLEE